MTTPQYLARTIFTYQQVACLRYTTNDKYESLKIDNHFYFYFYQILSAFNNLKIMSELSKYVNSRQFLYYLWSISNLYIALYVCTSYNGILIKLLVSKGVTTGTVYLLHISITFRQGSTIDLMME